MDKEKRVVDADVLLERIKNITVYIKNSSNLWNYIVDVGKLEKLINQLATTKKEGDL